MFKDPFIISSFIFAITFFLILLLNHTLKNRLLKLVLLLLGFTCFVLILVFDNPYIYQLLRFLIAYFWYPDYLTFVTVILLSVLIFIYTILREKKSLLKKILNYIMFSIAFCTYIIFQRIDINPESYTSLYSSDSLIVMRILTISFAVWILITIIINIIKRGKDEK